MLFLVLFGPYFWLFSQKITFLIQAFLFLGPYYVGVVVDGT